MSVFDNVRTAVALHHPHGIREALWRGRVFRDGEKAIEEQVMALLEIFELGKLRDEPANCLPYGSQRRLEIVRALATKPKLLLLDEPAAGMNPTEKLSSQNLSGLSRRSSKSRYSWWSMTCKWSWGFASALRCWITA